MKTDYQNKDMAQSLDEAKATVRKQTMEFSFPMHGITVTASSIEEATAMLEKQLQTNSSKE